MQCSTFLVFLCITTMTGVLSDRHAVVVLSFGGLQSGYMKSHMPKLKKLRKKYASPKYLKPVFTPKSPVNHISIATGLYAEDHNVIDNCEYDEPKNRCEYGQPNSLITPIWIENQNNGGVSGVMNWPGAERKYQNKSPTYYQNHTKVACFEDDLDTIIDWLIHKKTNLVMAYFDELDNYLHKDDPMSAKGIAVTNKIENIVETFIKKLDNNDLKERTNLMILGTQGIFSATYNYRIDLDEIFKENNISCTYIAMATNAIVTPKSGEVDSVYKILDYNKSQNSPSISGMIKYRVYRQNQIPETLHIKKLDILKDKLFIVATTFNYFWNHYLEETMNKQLSEGLITSKKNFEVGFDGYSNDVESMRSFFIAMGPSFLPEKMVPPFETVDIHPLLRNLLKLEGNINEVQRHKEMNNAVKELLKDPPKTNPPKTTGCKLCKVFSRQGKPNK